MKFLHCPCLHLQKRFPKQAKPKQQKQKEPSKQIRPKPLLPLRIWKCCHSYSATARSNVLETRIQRFSLKFSQSMWRDYFKIRSNYLVLLNFLWKKKKKAEKDRQEKSQSRCILFHNWEPFSHYSILLHLTKSTMFSYMHTLPSI